MYSYEKATELYRNVQSRWDKWTPNEIMDSIGQLVDTIEHHELMSEESLAATKVLNEAISYLNLEISDLKQERDDLIDKNQRIAAGLSLIKERGRTFEVKLYNLRDGLNSLLNLSRDPEC